MNYFDISKFSDLEDPKERKLYRMLELLPASLSFGILILLFAASKFFPVSVAIFIIIFDLYWFFRSFYFIIFKINAYKRFKKSLNDDWTKKLNELKNYSIPVKNWKDIYQLIILPNYKEGEKVVEETLDSLKNCIYPKDKMIIVFACEERAGEERRVLAEKMQKKYEGQFLKFFTTFHPFGLPDEAIGKGSNNAWGLKEAKEKIIDKLNIPYEQIIVSNFDVDTKPYPQYFLCLTWNYLTAKKPLQATYQPIPVYNNNIWDAPAFSRVISISGTFWQLIQQTKRSSLVSFSSHSIPFSTILKVKYPNNLIPDDSRIFWKCVLYFNGNYRVIPLFYPVSMDAIQEKSYIKTAKAQYKQQQRWAWGCTDIPFLIFAFYKNKKIALGKKLIFLWNLMEGHTSWAIASLIIFFFGWMPLLLGGEKFNSSVLAYNLPRIASNIMTIAMIGLVAAIIVNFLLLPPRPKSKSRTKSIIMVLQWLLLPITFIFFSAFPALDAQLRLFFGKYLEFWPTPKFRN
ncbi:MAG: glycosyltransferase family 2 protein [bacterium]|nr:glycosyltransferase family 2 protein [bacterium]